MRFLSSPRSLGDDGGGHDRRVGYEVVSTPEYGERPCEIHSSVELHAMRREGPWPIPNIGVLE